MANIIIVGNTVIELNDEQMNTVLAVVRGLSASAKSVAPTSRSEVKSTLLSIHLKKSQYRTQYRKTP